MQKIFVPLLAAIMLIAAGAFAQKKETRNVSSFTSISFGVPGKLYLRQGNEEKVELEGDPDLLAKILTEVNGNHLDIHTERKWREMNWGGKGITAYVTIKNIEGVIASGSGDVVGQGVFEASNIKLGASGSGNLTIEAHASGQMTISLSGSGNMDVKGKSKSLDSSMSGSGEIDMAVTVASSASFSISGSGKVTAKGSSEVVKIFISGSAKILAADFETNVCDIKISGSGDVEISVKDEIDANILGSGNVSYRGNPSKVNSHSTGSGKMHKM